MKLSSLLKWGVGVTMLLVMVGIVLSNYSAGIYLVIGIAILIGFRFSIHLLGWKTLLIATVILCLVIGLSVIGFQINPNMAAMPCDKGEIRSELELTGYEASVELQNFSEGSFKVSEHVTYNELESTCNDMRRWESELVQENLEMDLPSRTIQSENNGLFVHEVFVPMNLEDYKCCPDQSSVAINNMPYNSFYDAQFAKNLEIDEYLGSSSVSWQSSRLGEGIRFAYLPSPFHNLRVLVTPFIEMSKYDNWLLAVVGFVFSSIFLSVIKPNVIGFINNKVKGLFKKDDDVPKRKPPKRRTNRNR